MHQSAETEAADFEEAGNMTFLNWEFFGEIFSWLHLPNFWFLKKFVFMR